MPRRSIASAGRARGTRRRTSSHWSLRPRPPDQPLADLVTITPGRRWPMARPQRNRHTVPCASDPDRCEDHSTQGCGTGADPTHAARLMDMTMPGCLRRGWRTARSGSSDARLARGGPLRRGSAWSWQPSRVISRSPSSSAFWPAPACAPRHLLRHCWRPCPDCLLRHVICEGLSTTSAVGPAPPGSSTLPPLA
jgi:hypothetical protein